MDQHGLCSIYTVKKLGNLQTAPSWQELHISISNHSDQQSSWSTTAYINLLPFQRFHLTRKKVTLLGQVLLQGPGRAQTSWITEAYWAYCWTVAPMFSHWLISSTTTKVTGNIWKQCRQSSPQKKERPPYQCGIHINLNIRKHVFWMKTYQHSPLPSLPWESTSQWMTPTPGLLGRKFHSKTLGPCKPERSSVSKFRVANLSRQIFFCLWMFKFNKKTKKMKNLPFCGFKYVFEFVDVFEFGL